jgi:hypothetical protein
MIEYSDEGDLRRTLNIYPVYRTSSGSQYLRTMVEATAEHLRLTHATTIEALKSF